VTDLRESELRAGPKDELLRQPRGVDRAQRRDERQLGDEVPIRDRVDAVAERALETELARDRVRVDRVWRAGEGRRAERRDTRALASLRDASAIAPDGLDVREQMVREGNRLSALKVG